jgi:hypothetical protein
MLMACSPETAWTTESPGAPAGPQVVPVDPVGIRPIPAIPVALRGCWQTDAPTDPDEPGSAHRLIVTATTIELQSPDFRTGIATAEFVERVTERLIEGRFSARAADGLSTVATSLSLEGDTLRRAEGDAGSDYYYRCKGKA